MNRSPEFQRRLELARALQVAGVRVDPHVVIRAAQQPGVRQPVRAATIAAKAKRQARRSAHAPRTGRSVLAAELRSAWRFMKIALALVVAYHVHSVLLPLTSPLHPKPDAGRIVAGHEGGSPGEVGASLDALVDELIAELDSAPNIAHTSGRMPPNCTAEFARLADEGGNDPHLSVLIRKLERWVNGYGVMVHWLPSCPVEPGQLWVGIYEPGSFRIRVCPLRSVAEKFDVLLHESGHLLQDRVFKHTFDQHEADAISWLVQRRLGIPVAFSTTGHMRGVYGSTSQDIRRRRDTIIRGATIILSALQ